MQDKPGGWKSSTQKDKVRSRKGMVLGSIETYDGTVTAVTPQKWGASLQDDQPVPVDVPGPVQSDDNTPKVHEEDFSDNLRGPLYDRITKYHKLWDGSLGTIKATEHRMRLKPGAKPVRVNPYRMGPRTGELIR